MQRFNRLSTGTPHDPLLPPKGSPAPVNASGRHPAVVLQVPRAQRAAQAVAQAHTPHPPPPATARPGQTPAGWTAPPIDKLQQPADIRYSAAHVPGFTAAQQTMAYGFWCLVTLVRTGAALAGGHMPSQAGPLLALTHSICAIDDAAGGVVSHGVARKRYKEAQRVYPEAQAYWRQLAATVGTQPLDEAAEQTLAASRHLLTLLTQILDGYESAYFPIAQANRLKARRDRPQAAEDMWLERQRQAPGSPEWAQRDQQLTALLDSVQELEAILQDPDKSETNGPPITRRDLEKLRVSVRRHTRRRRELEQLETRTPAQEDELGQLNKERSEFMRLKPFFTRSQGPTPFLNPDELAVQQLALLRDAGLNKLTQPFMLGAAITGLFVQFLPAVSDVAKHGMAIAGAELNLLLAPATFAYAHYDAEFSARSRDTARKQRSTVYQQLGSAVALKRSLRDASPEHTVGRYLVENRTRCLLATQKQHKRNVLFFFWRSFRDQITTLVLGPVSLGLGAATLGLYLVGNLATGGGLAIATGVIAGVSLGALLAAVAWRCWRAKQAEDEDKRKLRAVQHLQHVLGADGMHQLYTLSETDFEARMKPVIASAPKGLRLEFRHKTLLQHNKFFASAWCARELLRGAQAAAREQGPVRDSFARQMLLNLGMSEADVNYLQTCRPFCRDDEHYLQVCRKTILAQLFNGTEFPDKQLPDRRHAVERPAAAAIFRQQLRTTHWRLNERIQTATSAQDLRPGHVPDNPLARDRKRGLEQELDALRADLLLRRVDRAALLDLRETVHHSDPLAWLLDALIAAVEPDPSLTPMPAPAQPLDVQAPLLSYDMLNRAILWVGRQREPAWVTYFKGNAQVPNAIGSARQFLEQRQKQTALDDEVLKALADWKRSELRKMTPPREVPEGYASMDAWLLAAMKDIAEKCNHGRSCLRITDDAGRVRGEKLLTRFSDWHIAAQELAKRLENRMKVPVIASAARAVAAAAAAAA